MVDEDTFNKEVTNVMRSKHHNIVQLVGYCAESRWEAIKLPMGPVMAQIPTRLLCFEYICNNSLQKHLSDESSSLDWNVRYEIIKGICSGLHFLHQECHIVHLDLKPENILMDDTMVPKIADFGLSKLLAAQKSQTIIHGGIAGTLGYMAPEYMLRGVVSPKVDMFSLGVIMIEAITGRKDDYPSSVSSFQQFNSNNQRMSTELSLEQYREDVLVKWRNVFEEEPKYTSPEIYTAQVKECITIALECVDPDSTRRPDICEIIERLTGEICRCQNMTLLSVQPSKLHFETAHVLSYSSLHLTNNTDHSVAFRIKTSDRRSKYFRPVHGLVLPRSMYTIRVAILPPKDDKSFTIMLECSMACDQYQLPDIQASSSAGDYNRCFFEDAKNKGHEVQQMKLLCTIAQEKRDVMILKYRIPYASNTYIHPTKTWIVLRRRDGDLEIWDYQREETVHLPELSALSKTTAAVFIPRKQWFVVGDRDGNIKVFSDETMQEVKTFSAHDDSIESFDIHPSEPYVLSLSANRYGEVKIWNWDKDWECVTTLVVDVDSSRVKFNPKDADYFACINARGVQVWNIASRDSYDLILSVNGYACNTYMCLDFLSRGDELYVITGNYDGPVKIWDWQRGHCLKTLEGHTTPVRTIYVDPDLPLFITVSLDGTVCLWNSSTFNLEGKLNCGLGPCRAIACLKGSNRIAIGHTGGLAIIEI